MTSTEPVFDLEIRRLALKDDETIWLYMGSPEHQLGQIVGVIVPVSDRVAETGLRAVEAAVGRTFSRVCLVANVFLRDTLLNRGHGVALYAALAELVARDFDAPILSDGCSNEAKRVWDSRRLRERAAVRDLCAFGVRSCAGAS